MNIVAVFLGLMFSISITLSIFAIRQRKNNKLLGELVAQTKVGNADIYSNVGVGIRDGSYVSKCPACAEWINIEATICRFCQEKVESTNQKLREAMQEIDISIAEAKFALVLRRQEQKKALLRNPLFRGSIAVILIIVITLIGIRVQSTFAYNKATAMPSSASELTKYWNSIIEECEFPKNSYELTVENQNVWLHISVDVYGSVSTTTTSAACFSKKAFAIDVFKRLNEKIGEGIYLRNYFRISYSGGILEFSWRPMVYEKQ